MGKKRVDLHVKRRKNQQAVLGSRKKEDDQNLTCVDLPIDVHVMIKSYLTPLDWKNYDSALFAESTIPNPPIPTSLPQSLMYHCDDDDTESFYFHHPLCLGYKSSIHIPGLSGSVICAAKYGWLLMYSAWFHSLFFFNPFTRSEIELPQLPESSYVPDSISFSSPPTSDDCIIFGVSTDYDKYSTDIIFIERGQDTWDISTVEYDTPFIPATECSPVFFDGAFYCLGADGNLGVYDPISDEWKILNHPKSPINNNLSMDINGFLLECDGKLLSVYMSDVGKNVSVFSLAGSRRRPIWKKVTGLGDKAVYLSRTASFAVKAQVKGMENKIYLNELYVADVEKDKKEEVVFYSLENLRYERFSNSDWSTQNLYSLKEYLDCTWIEPATDGKHPVLEELDWLVGKHE